MSHIWQNVEPCAKFFDKWCQICCLGVLFAFERGHHKFFCRSVRFLKILPGDVYSISRSDIPLFLRWYFLKYPYLLMHRGGAILRANLAWCLFCCTLRSFLHVSAGNDDLFLFKRTNFAVKTFLINHKTIFVSLGPQSVWDQLLILLLYTIQHSVRPAKLEWSQLEICEKGLINWTQ